MRILLTGATGFIGRHVLPEISDAHTILALTRAYPSASTPYPNVVFAQANLMRADEVRQVMEQFKPDMLIHLAWYVEPGSFWTSPHNVDWLASSLFLIRYFIEQGGKRMVLAGSCAEYDWSASMPLTEGKSAVNPDTLYAACKNSLREISFAYAAQAGVDSLWCRFFWPYGYGEPKGKFLSSIMDAIARGEQAVCRNPNLKRDYIHVQDAARALTQAAFSSMTGELNIGTGEAVSLGELASMAAAAMGHPDMLKLEHTQITALTPETIKASTERLCNELGWVPLHDIAEGIRHMSVAIVDALEQR